MPDESDPPRKFYDFKHREFERANKSAHPPEPPPIPLPLPASAPPIHPPEVPIDIQQLYQQASVPGPVLSTGQRSADPNDVHAILRDNLERANALGMNQVAPPAPRKSKRARDYWRLVIGINIILGFLAVRALTTGNIILLVYSIGGMGLITAGLTWIMWVVMDRY